MYWKLKAVEYHYYGGPLDRIGHRQLHKAEIGDMVWIVTMRGGDLLLVGRLVVGEIIDSSESDAVFDSYDLWQPRWIATAAEDTAEPMQLINLTERSLVLSLRFESRADRLRINRKGRLNALSLYHLRRLTDESAVLLNSVWQDGQIGIDLPEQVDIDRDLFLYEEGQPHKRPRMIRQRSSRLTNEAKARRIEDSGELRCEVCGVNFGEMYGDIGEGYIEIHHVQPLAEVNEVQFVDVDAVVLLCANCHRMLHRRTPPYSLEDLREAIKHRRIKQSPKGDEEANV